MDQVPADFARQASGKRFAHHELAIMIARNRLESCRCVHCIAQLDDLALLIPDLGRNHLT